MQKTARSYSREHPGFANSQAIHADDLYAALAAAFSFDPILETADALRAVQNGQQNG
jgi:hypothetical protein